MGGSPDQTYSQIVLTRRSIRGYLDRAVPRALIEEVLAMAMRSPTSMNTQPWHFHVITGEPLDRIRKGNTENILAGVPDSREFRRGHAFEGVHRERQVEVAKQLFGAMGIERDDKEGRQDWVLRGFRQFDAPVCVIVTYDRELGDSDDTAFDCGAVTTALVNAAWSRGLGCVINSQGIMQSPVVREHANIPDDQVIMKAVAMGWPDPDFPANAVVSKRKSVAEAARFVGFE
ncbi:Nitroreductase [Erythrobacter litoralis]|uniref:Nitroreductase n=1 Tax=Erythrobacter litoralis TaxID=39960 RepID=A0A074MUN8_9SPHN|nr:nitroreductase [Erythrobacter litoralis]AOL23790.1 Nitroreductase [Erythrobacter litoralis]KEO98726.1 nitroreductase [Erythrobacter litoralis]MEE4339382.1 nitroreductase [Erythrobacter sp.]